jgi:tetratricopeptide (TPR) repeat protein
MRRRDANGRTYFQRGEAINPAALRQARINRGWSLEQTSHGIVTRQALQQFEAGRTRPTEVTLKALAERLGVSSESLLARPHDPRERAMRELDERQDWRELERLATVVLADLNVTLRTQAVGRFYLGRAVLDVAPDEALAHFRQARGHLAKLGEPWLAAEAREWEGAALYLMQSSDALEVGRDALARYRMLTDRDPAVEARMLEHIGTYQLQRQAVTDAMDSYRAAIDVAGNVLNLARLANLYHGLASGFLRLGQPREALEYFERAVGFLRTHHDVRRAPTAKLARLESDYGDFLVRTGRLDRAEEMIQAALDHFQAAGVEVGQASTMLSMGDLKHQLGDMDEAMRWTSEAIEMAERLGETVSLAVGYQQLAELCAAQGDLDRCEAAFSRAIHLLDRAGLRERRAEAVERYRRVRAGIVERQREG